MEAVTLRKAYRVRLLPTAAQQERLLRCTATRRYVYTGAPAWRKSYDHERGKSPRHVHVDVRRRHNAHSERS